MIRSHASIVLIVMGVASHAHAQTVNVLSHLGENTTDGVGGHLGVSLVWKSGNTHLVQAKTSGGLAYRFGENVVFLVARGSFGTKSSLAKASLRSKKVFVSSVFEHLRYRRTLLPWLFAEAYAQHEADRFIRLSTRGVWGLGPRVSAAPFENIELSLGTSYMLEREIYSQQGSSPRSSETNHRWSTYLQTTYEIASDIRLHNTTFVQARFDSFSDVRILSQSALRLSANAWLGVRLSFNVAYDSRPPARVERLDTGVESTLEFSF